MVEENFRANCLRFMLLLFENSFTEKCPFVLKMVSMVDFTILSMFFLSASCLKRKTSTISKNFDLIKDDHDLLVCNNSGEVVINLEHINIKNLITNQLSKSKKEFIIDQLSRQIKKFTNSSAK